MSKGGGATAIGPRSTHWRSAIALMASFAGFALIFGFTIPLCALILEADGVSTTLSGAITAISAAGMMVASPFVGRMTALFGTRRVMFVAAVLTTATIVLLPVLDSVYAWFPIRFVYGAGLSTLLILCQSWFNEVVADEIRGRMVGLFIATASVGISAAPIILNITGYIGWAPIIAASAITLLAAIPLMAAREVAPDEGDHHSPAMLIKFLRVSPSAVWGAFLLGVIEAGVLGLLPIYSLRLGSSESAAILLVAAYFAGGILLAVTFGWLADRIDRRTVLVLCAGLTLVTVLALPISGSIAIWPVVFLWGGAAVAIYSISLTILGQRFRGAELAAASAMLIFMMSVGNVFGPFSAGIAMDIWNPYGLLLILGLISAAYTVLVVYQRFSTQALSADDAQVSA